jgi:hypothetical protein
VLAQTLPRWLTMLLLLLLPLPVPLVHALVFGLVLDIA